MKTLHYLKYTIILSLFAVVAFTGCEEEKLGDPPRLFRPIVSMSNQGNDLIAEWDNLKDALYYELKLYKANGTDEAGADIFELYREVETNASPYTFENVEWDEKYKIEIKAFGETLNSNVYETDDYSVIYISKMTSVRVIDNAALLMWKKEGDLEPITHFKLINEAEMDTVDVDVSLDEFERGQMTFNGLMPETQYRIQAYTGEEQNGDTYDGRIRFKTVMAENYDEIYGEGRWTDLRGQDDPDVIINNFSQLSEFDAVILEGGFQYNVSNLIAFERSITFTTGLSLAGNAVFVHSGGLKSAANGINLLFNKIDFISDKALETPVRENTDKGFGGRQVYNVNNDGFVVGEMKFSNCRFEGFRAVIRLQGGGVDGIEKLSFHNCTFNGIGDQAVITTNNQANTLNEVNFTDCTLLNVVMLCDLRASKTPTNLTVDGCTFCYAPIETIANGNTPLFRLGNNAVVLSINNSIFGPSVASTGSAGSDMLAYTAGKKGSVLLAGANALVSANNSYKTNFEYTEIGEGKTTYPIADLANLAVNEKELFLEPEDENFTIVYSFAGAKTAGASKWRMP